VPLWLPAKQRRHIHNKLADANVGASAWIGAYADVAVDAAGCDVASHDGRTFFGWQVKQAVEPCSLKCLQWNTRNALIQICPSEMEASIWNQ